MKFNLVRHAALAILVLSAIVFAPYAVAAEPDAQAASQDKNQTAEVEVNASRLDQHTLNHVAMKFVELHAAANPTIKQMVRWRAPVCPKVTGLKSAAGEFVTRQVEQVARSVGAPTGQADKNCAINVEVVFTLEPKQLLDHIAQAYPVLLGSSQSASDTAFGRAIQSWYLTGTRSTTGFQPPTPDPTKGQTDTGVLLNALSDPQAKSSAESVDPANGTGAQPSGLTGSYFTKGLTSDLQHVLIIVDTAKIATHSLRSIADYIAMLALTRVSSLDACSELPSIIDLLSSGCSAREKPPSLTAADTAYLKALYSSDMEANLNLEQGDIRDRMIKTLVGK